LALYAYIGEDDVSAFDVLAALDTVRETIVEELIREHPELVPQLALIMKMHSAGHH